MRRFRDIIEDVKAPNTDNLWISNGELKYFSNGIWTSLGNNEEDSNEEDSSVSFPKEVILNGIAFQSNTGQVKLNYPIYDAETGMSSSNFATIQAASPTGAGVMSSTDKIKLNGIEAEANKYSLPDATTSVRGGILMAASVANLTGTEDTAAICTKINDLLAALRTAGVLQS